MTELFHKISLKTTDGEALDYFIDSFPILVMSNWHILGKYLPIGIHKDNGHTKHIQKTNI
jgi:hypothetical protein